MSQQVSKPAEDTLVSLTDRNLIVTLTVYGIPFERKMKTGYKTIFYYRREDVKEVVEFWQSGRPIPLPVNDIRSVFTAETAFNSATHDDL
jgi:hypothetical protein